MSGTTFRPYEGDEPYIFVSYSRKNKKTVLSAIEALAGAGYRVWYDEGIPWTEEWPRHIAERMDRCAVCLAFHSAASAQSRHCKAELHRALSKERHILSVYLEESVQLDPGLEMYLALVQAVKSYDLADIDAFVTRLGQEAAFVPCRIVRDAPDAPALTVEWERSGQIQWYLDRKGVLTVAKASDLRSLKTVPIPDFQLRRPRAEQGDYQRIQQLLDAAFSGRRKLDKKTEAAGPPDRQEEDEPGKAAPWMAFRDEIRAVTIWNDIDAIGQKAFIGCAELTSVTIPDSVTSIGNEAFRDCIKLTKVTIGNGVGAIGDQAFADCVSLKDLTIPDSVTTIGWHAFWHSRDLSWDGLVHVKIGRGVERSIIASTFSGRWSLAAIEVDQDNETYRSREGVLFDKAGTSLILYPRGRAGKIYAVPDGVSDIYPWAFGACRELTTVQIPGSVTSIDEHAFSPYGIGIERDDWAGLAAIEVDQDNETYRSREGVLFDKAGTVLIRYPVKRPGTTYAIPDGVTTIGDYAFSDCHELESVRIPDSVTMIGDGAFDGCVGLTSVSIPDSVTAIGDWAFYRCRGLTSVTIPDNVTTIGDWAFDRCVSLTSVSIPDSVTAIGDYAFWDSYKLKSVKIPEGAVLGENAFFSGVRIVRRPPRGDAPWWMWWSR